MQVHQFVHTLNYGDAISGEALAIKEICERQGITSTIYCLNAHEKVEDKAEKWTGDNQQWDQLKSLGKEDVVILHYSIASLLNDIFRELENTKRAVIHHNLTPVKWFQGYNPRVVEDLERGIAELPELFALADLVIADSEYNKQELVELGFNDVRVLPLLLDKAKWDIAANAGMQNVIRKGPKVNLLHVGRVAPNKCIEDIIKAFYFYHHKIEQGSKLWLVGIDIDTELYSFELRRLLAKLQLQDAVEFVGALADSELKSFYQNCDAYLCMSEHEGFCLPLVEAMHFELPVIAYNACAVGATLGEGGVLVSEKSPAKLAELINIVVGEEEVRSNLKQKGLEQIEAFSLAKFEPLLLKLLSDIPANCTVENLQNERRASSSRA